MNTPDIIPEFSEDFIAEVSKQCRELGFEPQQSTGNKGMRFVRKSKLKAPGVNVRIDRRKDANNETVTAVSVDGEPYRVYGGSVEAVRESDPQKVIEIIQRRLEFYRKFSKK